MTSKIINKVCEEIDSWAGELDFDRYSPNEPLYAHIELKDINYLKRKIKNIRE